MVIRDQPGNPSPSFRPSPSFPEFPKGFEVVLIYIGTESVEINLARIAKRVRAGGHDVPEMDVRRRYLRGIQNLPVAAGIADRVLLFDNSNDLGYAIVISANSREPQLMNVSFIFRKA